MEMKIIELFGAASGEKVAEIPLSELERMHQEAIDSFFVVQAMQGRVVGVAERKWEWENGNLGGRWTSRG